MGVLLEMLAAKTHDLNSIPGTYMVEGENIYWLSSDLYIWACTYTHIQNKYIKKTKNKRAKYLCKQVFPFITKKKQKSHHLSGQYL